MPTETTLKPADRAELLGFSDIVKIRNRVLDMKAGGARVLQLEGGEPFPGTPDFGDSRGETRVERVGSTRCLLRARTRFALGPAISGLTPWAFFQCRGVDPDGTLFGQATWRRERTVSADDDAGLVDLLLRHGSLWGWFPAWASC